MTDDGLNLSFDLENCHKVARSATERMGLPVSNRLWSGFSGHLLGHGTGSSIDFHDHRPYLPGDDPRYIDWLAYARSGQYTMKLYRAEVSPMVDLVMDVSNSMFFEETKRKRTLELFYFAVESSFRLGSNLQCYLIRNTTIEPVLTEAVLNHSVDFFSDQRAANEVPTLDSLPWRMGTLRVFISDLLYLGGHQEILSSLSSSQGKGVIFAPWSQVEKNPEWAGNIEFLDCESGINRKQRVTEVLRQRYLATYERHFESWNREALKFNVALARIGAEFPLVEALHEQALKMGAVELV